MEHLQSVSKGPFTFFTIETGRFSLDGGAMFGVVPKTLWSKKIQADEYNRIPMAMRCLLVHSSNTGRLYLIDNGCGDKFDEKMEGIYNLTYPFGNLGDSLRHYGFTEDDVTDMVFTHLHFDHCGGSTKLNENSEPELVFKNATHWVSTDHWVTATNPNAREKASFFKENIDPMRKSGQLKMVQRNHIFEEGFTCTFVHGHTKGQLLPTFDVDDFKMVYAADLIPTYAHIPLPWVMGYDMAPVDTLTEKDRLLKEWAEEKRFVFLEHDAHHQIVTVKNDKGRFSVDSFIDLKDL